MSQYSTPANICNETPNTSEEVWKDVSGYEGWYQVSTEGRVRSLPRTLIQDSRWNGKVARRMKGKLLRLRTDKDGYKHVELNKNGVPQPKPVHRLVLETFVGPCPNNTTMQCRHLNGIPDDNRLVNLAWGTLSENQQDRFTHGTDQRGAKHPLVKLAVDDVIEIRRLYSMGERSASVLAQKYGVHAATIRHAVRGDSSWRYIDGGIPNAFKKEY